MVNKLLTLSHQFRKAIDYIKGARLCMCNSYFDRFPVGCCGDTSDLLAQYLYDHGIIAKYVWGTWYGTTSYDSQSHAWLLVNDLIIDITGDQFRNNRTFYNFDKQVYVGPINQFYELFELGPCSVHEYKSGAILTAEQRVIYKKIMECINRG